MSDKEKGERALNDLLAMLVQANYDNYTWLTNQILSAIDDELVYEKARVACIQSEIYNLFQQPHQPSQYAIMRALFPEEYMIEKYIDVSRSVQPEKSKWASLADQS